jgi:hypothetical protein
MMARLKKTEIYAISWLFSQNISPENIAQELNLGVDQVTKALEKTHPSEGQNSVNIKTKTSPSKSKSKDLMITATSSKKSNNVSIMTKEASEYNDSIRNKNTGDTNKSIFRPKNNE